MSYSRWGNSVWYSYWSAHSGKSKDDQVLSLTHRKWNNCDNYSGEWTYEELKNVNMGWVRENYSDITAEDAQEAVRLIGLFMQDVDEEFVELIK